MPDTTLTIFLITGFVLGGFLLYLWFRLRSSENDRRQDERVARDSRTDLEKTVENLVASNTALTGRLEQLTTTTQSSQAHLIQTITGHLEKVSQGVNERLSTQGEKTTESLTKLTTRLAVIDQAQKNITDLSSRVVSLQDILANKQARGAFGEIQLNDLVKNILPPSAYDFQVTLSNNRRADCMVKLPNPPGSIVIDAKFPLEAYYGLRKAKDPETRAKAGTLFRRAIQKHIKDISERYIIRNETAESALMFIPAEAVYAELHTNFQDIVQESYKARVWIVSPTTVMATLNTIRAVLKDSQMREQAHLIQQEVGRMIPDIARLSQRVDNLQKHFSQVQGDIVGIQTSNNKIAKRADSIDDMELGNEGEQSENVLPARQSAPVGQVPTGKKVSETLVRPITPPAE